ncbi:MAG TPA: ATP-binding protein [Candidatus Acidoferrum sp.]|nr:ATP-binding protein [Candidatus Acidoferrum sp.]
MSRRSWLVYGLLAAVWVLVLGWQVEEHLRFTAAARTDLRGRSKDIANTLSAFIRGLRFREAVRSDRVESVLNELVNGRTNDLVRSSDVMAIALLNPAGETLVSAGRPIDLEHTEVLQEGEHWGRHSVTLVNPVDLGASLASEGATNPTVLLPPPPPRDPSNTNREPGRGFFRREPPPGEAPPTNAVAAGATNGSRPVSSGTDTAARSARMRRAPWLRGMPEAEYQALLARNALHDLVIAMSTDSYTAACTRDLWVRAVILLLATISVLGSGLAWRNLSKTSELEIRLVRASELNTHLKEMNLAAAGLAHETRNPLNIIRGLAQMISKHDGTVPEIQNKSREIVDEADKVAAQLNEFINYSRPREVRRSALALGSVVSEVVRALSYDLEEKKIGLQVKGEQLSVEADEQLLRQALFNLILNAIQAVEGDGQIQVVAEKRSPSEAVLEVRDNGPGVPPERRTEIFKPYFTTQKKGTGLGLAVVQQIVLAHGWEVECLPNEPKGAVFRITHLKLAA